MASTEEKKRTRSPAYPSIDLKEAIQCTKSAYDEEDRHAFTPEAAAEHWGYKPTSSAVSQIVSALKQFGLFVEEPGNGVRRLRLSSLALDLMVHEDETDSHRIELLKTAALNPKIHREIWERYTGRLPSDASLRIYLLRERVGVPFNKDQVDRFISQLRETIEFAKLSESDKLSAEGEEAGGKAVHGAAVNKDVGWSPDIVSVVESVFPLSPKPPDPKQSRGRSMQAESGFQQAVFPLTGGNAIVQWPEHISSAEFEDFQDWLELVIRKVKRSVSVSHSAPDKGSDSKTEA